MRCRSPLVSTPNVNNFLDIRSHIVETFDFSFSDSMFILKVLKDYGGMVRGSLGRGRWEGGKRNNRVTSSWAHYN